MNKSLLVLMLVLGLVVMGCGGDGPKDELGQSGNRGDASSENGETSGDDATDLSDRGSVESETLSEYGFQTIYFDFDRFSLRADAREELDRNYQTLVDNPQLMIVIEGHCDERGTDEYNLALGERRAKSAKDYLVKLGIDPSRVALISYGEERPVTMGHNESAWSQNRRGEFEIQ